MPSEYRAEIDGLRALAVIPVIFYHAGLPGFTGGYIGVDIFFVISGFLITGILLRSIQEDRFSILEFYERRIRRIFPALFAVAIATVTCASWLLFPEELRSYGKSLFATSLFYANYHFMYDTGYFAAPAESKPLLHMWSLAVEEQFYVLFPLYLYAVWRWCRRYLLSLTLVLAVLSLGYSIWLMGQAPDQAFYSAPARAWELLVGALLALLGQRFPAQSIIRSRSASLLTVLGLVLMLFPVAMYSEFTRFPGATAIPPVLGCAIVLFSSQIGGRASALLSISPLRGVGLISYSLYLWHWPIFVFFKTFAIEPLTATQKLWMLVSVFVVAFLSWRFVETPFRKHNTTVNHKRVIAVGFSVMCAGFGIGAIMTLGSGLPNRFSPEVRRILDARTDEPIEIDCVVTENNAAARIRSCAVNPSNDVSPSFVVWGDSHAEALLPAIFAAAHEAGVSGLAAVRGGCPALVGVRQTRDGYRDCDESSEAFMKYLAQHPELEQVVLISRWALYAMGHRFRNELGHVVFIGDSQSAESTVATNQEVFERGFMHTLDRISKLGRRVVVVSQVPEAEYRIPLAMARAEHLHRTVQLAPTYQEYLARQVFVEEVFSRHLPRYNGVLLRPERILCMEGVCSISTDGLPIYRDSNHLTRTGAIALARVFKSTFSNQIEHEQVLADSKLK